VSEDMSENTEMANDPKAVFDPADEGLMLNRAEKLRSTALLLAIKYYSDTIVKDGALYNALKLDNVQLQPTSYERVVDIAIEFAIFLGTGLTPVQAREVEAREADLGAERKALDESRGSPNEK